MDSRFDVELVSVSKRYGTTLAVDAISLRIPAASYCCLLGPSGCGKTTTLRMIAGHEAISSGDILIRGENVSDLAPIRRGETDFGPLAALTQISSNKKSTSTRRLDTSKHNLQKD